MSKVVGHSQLDQAPQVEEQNGLLAYSSETQPSWEDDELGGGVFTAFLPEALSGKGDANNNGYVTLQGAFVYLVGRVEGYSKQKGMSRTPTFGGVANRGLRMPRVCEQEAGAVMDQL